MFKKQFLALALVAGSAYHSSAQCTVSLLDTNVVACQWDTNTYIHATPGGSFYKWFFPGQNPITTTADSILLNTSIPGTQTMQVMINVNNCIDTSDVGFFTIVYYCNVWPGDVNTDNIADNNDALDLALCYGQTGAARVGGNNTWIHQPIMNDWGTQQVSGHDMKFADCNGDGIVDINDNTAISLNYGLTHAKGVHTPQAKSAADPDLYFDLTGINFTAGTTVTIPIKLGTTSIPMNNIMGIAADVKLSGITLNNAPTISNTISWMGNGTNTYNFTKDVNANRTDWTLARTDHSNVSGNGTIATLTMDIPVGSVGQDVIFYFDDVKIIDNAGNTITNVNIVDDTASIVPVNVNAVITNIQYAAVVPNPSGAQASLQVSLAEANGIEVNITDVTGRNIWSKKASASSAHNISLPADVASGIYIIQVKTTTNGAAQSLKWVKK